MSRAPRVDVGGQVYHIINRANTQQTLFHTDGDYRHFEFLVYEKVPDTIIPDTIIRTSYGHPKKNGSART